MATGVDGGEVARVEDGVGAGELVVIPARQWHAFANSGDGPLRQLDLHLSASFDTEWLVQ